VSALTLFASTLRALRRRFGLLAAFGALLLASAAASRLISGAPGHVELNRIFELGGTTLASAFLLIGWVVGRFPLVATLVLFAGFFSQDRESGLARLYLARPISPLAIYGVRFLGLAAAAFVISCIVLPLFDLILLGHWAGPATLVLVAAHVIAYAGLVALLSVWTRADAWVALLLAIAALAWDALRSADMLAAVPPGGRQFVSFVLPPHGALFALESAFGNLRPIPWSAFTDVCIYGASLTLVAALFLRIREV